MIKPSAGPDVLDLLERITAFMGNYAEIVVCSPFIDPSLMRALSDLVSAARVSQCAVRIITTPSVGKSLRAILPGDPREWERAVLTKPRLHAKVYLAIGRTHRTRSEAIVTSANLTDGGIRTNLEFGIHVVSTSEAGNQLLRHVHHFVRRLAA